ncbi:MAG: GGDEF domain-containing protein [Desulfobacteraceae bacterium]|nr:GGDEF domain-containing protein [Desulfobacteraceae bacterium]
MPRKANPQSQCSVKECPFLEEMTHLREQCRKLEELSYVDGLTGLYNFRYMQRSLEMEMERTRRTKTPTSLIMIDLDHFKKINTEHGHESGNIALTWVAKIIRDSVRIMDIPCRYGGEEFALILPSTSLSQAVRIAERLRETLAANPASLIKKTVALTASFGVAVYGYTDNLTVSEFLNRADRFLFQAKSLGRNRVCAEEPVAVVAADEVSPEEKAVLFGPVEDESEEPST